MTNWPYDKIFEQPRKGLKQQVLITYELKDCKMIKTTVIRRFYGEDDYQDSTSHEVICDAAY